jgi:hypothetical protein
LASLKKAAIVGIAHNAGGVQPLPDVLVPDLLVERCTTAGASDLRTCGQRHFDAVLHKLLDGSY